MTTTTGTPTARLTLRDKVALDLYLARFSWSMQDYPAQEERAIRRELRAQVLAAASDVGMPRALADLGHPYALADGYKETRDRRLPRWATGAVAAGVAVGMLLYLTMAYSFGVLDTLTALGGGTVTLDVLGTPSTFEASDGGMSMSTGLGWRGLALYVAVGLVAFLLGSRAWRAFRR